MEDAKLTELAYEYAKTKKKVNEGVIEAFKFAYDLGCKDTKRMSNSELIKLLQSRFRNKEQIDYDLGMSDARRGINSNESKEIELRKIIDDFADLFENKIKIL